MTWKQISCLEAIYTGYPTAASIKIANYISGVFQGYIALVGAAHSVAQHCDQEVLVVAWTLTEVAGLLAAAANGRKGGRPRKVGDADAAKARELKVKGISASDIAKMLGVSRATVYRYLPMVCRSLRDECSPRLACTKRVASAGWVLNQLLRQADLGIFALLAYSPATVRFFRNSTRFASASSVPSGPPLKRASSSASGARLGARAGSTMPTLPKPVSFERRASRPPTSRKCWESPARPCTGTFAEGAAHSASRGRGQYASSKRSVRPRPRLEAHAA